MTEPVGLYGVSAYPEHALAPSIVGDNESLMAPPLIAQYGSMGALQALLAVDARNDTRAATEDVQKANEDRRDAWAEQLAAMKRQQEAEDDGGFWGNLADSLGTVAKVAGCVVAVAVAVGTAGAATPIAALAIAGAAASCLSAAQSELGVLDGALGKETADTWGTWLGVGGAIMSAGAGGAAWLTDAAAAEGMLAKVAEKAMPWAAGVAGVSLAGAGAATIAEGHSAGAARDHAARAAEAIADQQRMRMLIQQLIATVEEAQERDTSNTETMTNIMQLESAATMAVVENIQ